MKKAEQIKINEQVLSYIESFNRRSFRVIETNRLRTCSASVAVLQDDFTGEVIYALTSYRTLIAVIDGNTLYDFLRYVYGYTSTSAQHIAKFRNDFFPYGCRYETLTYRYVKEPA